MLICKLRIVNLKAITSSIKLSLLNFIDELAQSELLIRCAWALRRFLDLTAETDSICGPSNSCSEHADKTVGVYA